jgi:putative phosphoribosyl transferase
MAAAEISYHFGAEVFAGPGLAGDTLPNVRAPTLLIVGGNQDVVIEQNEMASDQMCCEVMLK